MEYIFITIGLVIIGLLIMVLKRNQTAKSPDQLPALTLLQQQMQELQNSLAQRMHESTQTMHRSLEAQSNQSQRIIENITERLVKLDETNKQVLSFSEQLRGLQDILKNPKQRGTILGEYFLETILQRVLPPGTYQTQYQFKSGEAVDAVVFVGKNIIPIDSKFSLDNYNRIIESTSPTDTEKFITDFKRDIKTRIDETSKYIRPEENTLDFAFMFIPHEAIYYDLLVAEVGAIKINTQDLVQYAFTKKVIMVSPTSFLAYLQTVLQGLRALQIEESAKEIRKNVEELGRHLQAYDEYHGKLGNALGTVVNHYNTTSKEFKKIDKDILRITGSNNSIETDTIDKPLIE